MLGTPKLARDEDLVARDARVPDPFPDFLLVPVDPGEVEVFVSVLQSSLDGVGDFARAGLPSSCPKRISCRSDLRGYRCLLFDRTCERTETDSGNAQLVCSAVERNVGNIHVGGHRFLRSE